MALPVIPFIPAILAALKVAFVWLWKVVIYKALYWLITTVIIGTVIPWIINFFTRNIGLIASITACLLIYKYFWEEIIYLTTWCGFKMMEFVYNTILQHELQNIDDVQHSLAKIYAAANVWIPLDFGMSLLTVYLMLFAKVNGWRATLKFLTGIHLKEPVNSPTGFAIPKK